MHGFVSGFFRIVFSRRHELEVGDDFVERGVGAHRRVDGATVRVKSSQLILEVKSVEMCGLDESCVWEEKLSKRQNRLGGC